MPMPEQLQHDVINYAERDLPLNEVNGGLFDFISDAHLAGRLMEEFKSARYLYKILEGLSAKDWLQRAQVRIQVLLYASIYEAVLHHVLFDRLRSDPRVEKLMKFDRLIKISVPQAKQAALDKHLSHDGKKIVPTYEGVGANDETKVRFDAKAKCAAEIGIITETLCAELIEIYEARNAIHLHAEIKKNLQYELALSHRAYRRMLPFRDQVRDFLART
ncbi:hypothetical protein [Sinorhizobium prairiense]|uniref:hypothetical protein n=1 Tax=unclassified Sinorhizobium TaxID=2613772 RepID=UPI0023D83FFB|nr:MULTISPECIES: hypothetical protein [unclassified Sinorhizobium]WEJ09301.1 hypothetical protein N0Q90_14420 [Sinorhizobium sp. M103]WEJ16156.1 hypothetical protein N0Q91_05895 [Sinorhizobium sp. K101]WEJ36266.1 hypothetical protein N0R80_14395 [Sinorhizobium sp. C101]